MVISGDAASIRVEDLRRIATRFTRLTANVFAAICLVAAIGFCERSDGMHITSAADLWASTRLLRWGIRCKVRRRGVAAA